MSVIPLRSPQQWSDEQIKLTATKNRRIAINMLIEKYRQPLLRHMHSIFCVTKMMHTILYKKHSSRLFVRRGCLIEFSSQSMAFQWLRTFV